MGKVQKKEGEGTEDRKSRHKKMMGISLMIRKYHTVQEI
jgi:hypothetical protein